MTRMGRVRPCGASDARPDPASSDYLPARVSERDGVAGPAPELPPDCSPLDAPPVAPLGMVCAITTRSYALAARFEIAQSRNVWLPAVALTTRCWVRVCWSPAPWSLPKGRFRKPVPEPAQAPSCWDQMIQLLAAAAPESTACASTRT